MSRTKSAALQFSGNMVLMFLSTVQGLLLIPLYLHYIGGYLYGAWLALAGSVVLLGMADMGISSLVIQRSAVFYSTNNYVALASLVGTMRWINGLTLIVIGIVAAILIPHIPAWINVLPQYHPILIVVAWITAAEIGLMLLVNVSGSFLCGVQNPGPHMGASIAGAVASIFITVVLLFSGFGVLSISIGLLVRPLIILPVNFYYITSFLAGKKVSSDVRIDKKMFVDLASNSIWLGPSKIAETMSGQIDSLIIARLLGPSAVSTLSITRKAADLSVQILGRICASLLSGLSHLHGSGQRELQRQVVKSLYKVIGYGSGIGLVGFLIFNERFVSLWTGREYFGGNWITFLICVYSMLKLFRIALYNIVFSFGDIASSAKSMVVEVSFQVVFGFVLGMKMGLSGIVIGAIVGIVFSTAMQLGRILLADVVDKSEFGLFVSKMIGCIACLVLSGYLINRNMIVEGWSGLVLGLIGYLLISAAMVFSTERELSLRLFDVAINQLRSAGRRA